MYVVIVGGFISSLVQDTIYVDLAYIRAKSARLKVWLEQWIQLEGVAILHI